MFCISLLQLVVLTLTLGCLVWYAYATSQIKKASVEQSEALQKPCITLRSGPRDLDDAILDGPPIAEITTPRLQILNIGSGPALRLCYELRELVAKGTVGMRPRGFLPHLQQRDSWEAPISRGTLTPGDFDFLAEYESLSGTLYQTRIRIENAVLVSFDFSRCEAQRILNASRAAR
jgi:hypothetical protein